jgi:excisionase family DNA binding protein
MSERLTLAIPLTPEQLRLLAEQTADLLRPELLAQSGEGASPWLSTPEAAKYLGVSKRTIERAVERGRLRAHSLGSRRLHHRQDLDAFVREATGEETAPTAPPRRRIE